MEELDEEFFTIDINADGQRIACMKYDKNIEIYKAKQGKFMVVCWEHQHVERLAFNKLSEAIEHCMEYKRIQDKVRVRYVNQYGGIS